MNNFFRIADNTFKESIREPIYLLMLLCALGLIGLFPSMSLFVFSEQLKMVVDSSMATSLLFGLLSAILCASNTVSREMRNGTILLLMSKPVGRMGFVLAKVVGIVLASSMFSLLCNLAAFVSVYIATDQFRLDNAAFICFFVVIFVSCGAGLLANFWRGNSISSVSSLALLVMLPIFVIYCIATKEHPALSLTSLAYALLLINFAVVAMSTLAVVFATRFDIVPNLTICSLFFFLGLLSGYLFGGDTGYAMLNLIFSVLYAILPNWQYFWLADAIASNRDIPFNYVLWGMGYIAIYVSFCSMWAVTIFHQREIAGSVRQ